MIVGVRKVSQLQKQMQKWQEELDFRLKGKKIPPKYWEFSELEKGNLHTHCAHCLDVDCKRTLNLGDPNMDDACGLIDCRFGCGAKYHACKSSEHYMICARYEETDDFEWMLQGSKSMQSSSFGKRIMERKKKKKLEQNVKPGPKESIGDLFVGPGEPATMPSFNKTNKNQVPAAPEPPKNTDLVNSLVRLDLRLETETRLQTKPKSMYTFVCAQQFRRDEYQWHSKNVHDDILGGMNNWLEHRCPMASYGCGFSMRRMYPKCDEKSFIPKNTIVFSPGVESFGVAPTSSTHSKNIKMDKKDTKRHKPPQSKTTSKKAVTQNSKSSVHITDLPYEILFQITQHLESFRYIENMASCLIMKGH